MGTAGASAGSSVGGLAGSSVGASGSAGQAGAAGAAGQAGAAGAAAISACAIGAAFCEDFEGHTAGAPPAGKWHLAGWPSPEGTFSGGDQASGGFALTVDEQHAFSGKQAAHVSVKYEGDGYAAIYYAAPTTIEGDAAYARFMLYQTSWERPHPSTIPGIHARVLFVGNASIDFDFSPTVFAFELGHDGFGGAAHGGPQPILNRWICVEAQFGPKLAAQVAGTPLSVPNGSARGFGTVALGISSYRTFSTDFWVDDLVVDTKPVPCPAP